jgi:biopolymer transport protein TolQ
MTHPFISTLMHSGPVGKTILGGLLVLSVYTWTVIFSKIGFLRNAQRATRLGLARFREGGLQWFEPSRAAEIDGPVGHLLAEGLREYRAQRELVGGGPLEADGVARIEGALEAETVDRINEMERGHLGLAIASSASPFIGLLGTTWGVMNSFRAMTQQGSAGIAAVAPGVAEALITTIAGLAVAIPAVVAYNLLNRRVQLITSILDRFSEEFVRCAVAASRRGAAARPAPAPAAAPTPEAASSFFARRNA